MIVRLSRNIWCSYFSLLSPCSVLSESSSSRTRNSEFESSSEYSQGPACDTGTCLFSPFEVRMVKAEFEWSQWTREQKAPDSAMTVWGLRWWWGDGRSAGSSSGTRQQSWPRAVWVAPGNWRKENLLNSRMEFMSLTWSLRMCTWWQKIARGNWNLNYLCS